MGENHAFVEVDESGRETCVLEREWTSGSVRRIELRSGRLQAIENGEVVWEGTPTSFFREVIRGENESETPDQIPRDEIIVAPFQTAHEGGTTVEGDEFDDMDGRTGYYIHNGQRRVLAEADTEAADYLRERKRISRLSTGFHDEEVASMPEWVDTDE